MSKNAIYSQIGITYDETRKADPQLAQNIIELLSPNLGGFYLDIGCGTGNYTHALAEKGYSIIGADISEDMLGKAKRKYPKIKFYQDAVEQLSFADKTFDGAISILATHHFTDLARALKSIYRVINCGNLVIFTSTPEQMQKYWLCEYFPRMMAHSMNKMQSFENLELHLKKAGFHSVTCQSFAVKHTLQDHFLGAGKYSPEIYLEPKIRAGISSFHLSITEQELNQGLSQLQTDIQTGQIKKVIEAYESDLGEYLFVTARKV